MKIAIDVSPLQTGHKVRGVGFYLTYLKQSLLTYFPENKYHFFTTHNDIPTDSDIVHYPYFDPFFVTLPLLKKHKTVVTVHDLTPIVFSKNFPVGTRGNLRWYIQRMSLRRADAVITDSQASKRDILQYAGVNEDKIAITYLAADEAFRKVEKSIITRIRQKYSLPDKFVLYVGDVTWNKNLPTLLESIKQTNIPIVMVGKSLVQSDFDKTNPWNHDLVQTQELMQEDKNIIPLGFVSNEDLVSLYNAATVFIMPSLYEGFGLPVIEAMQSGCPVITTKNGSLPEVAGDAAFYIEGNSKSIVRGIEKVFHDSQLQAELTRKGLLQAKKFSWKKTAQQTIDTYKKVLG